MPIVGSPKWKLFLVLDDADFEADFVIARDAAQAERVFQREYGDLPGHAELVVEIERPPAWLTTAMWLGADPDLSEFGGKRLASLDFPRWEFNGRAWGCPKTLAQRYPKPGQG